MSNSILQTDSDNLARLPAAMPFSSRRRATSGRTRCSPRPAAVVIIAAGAAFAASGASAAIDAESKFVLNTFAMLIWGSLVMWMCAGFTMLEAGMVRTKNASTICLKNVGLYCIAGLSFYFVGFNLMYTGVGDWIGTLRFFHSIGDDEIALLRGDHSASATVVSNSYATMSGWFFSMVFVATCASVVSGSLAERVKIWSFFVFIAILAGLIYPAVVAWTWGGGWLAKLGFRDFAGSTIVHSTGGWAALAGIIVVGARTGKFRTDRSVKPTPPSNVPAVTLGVFILWFGWFGFNGGSQLALGSAADAVIVATILVNTNLAAAAGVVTALVLSRPVLGRIDLLATLNGAIGGLVAITAAPDILINQWALVVGAAGGAIVVFGSRALELCRLDDVVGAVPAHLFAGIWGTLATSFTAGADFFVQLLGIAAIGGFVFLASLILWWSISRTIGARISITDEALGQDAAELGIEAYPEFMLMPDADDLKEIGDDSAR